MSTKANVKTFTFLFLTVTILLLVEHDVEGKLRQYGQAAASPLGAGHHLGPRLHLPTAVPLSMGEEDLFSPDRLKKRQSWVFLFPIHGAWKSLPLWLQQRQITILSHSRFSVWDPNCKKQTVVLYFLVDSSPRIRPLGDVYSSWETYFDVHLSHIEQFAAWRHTHRKREKNRSQFPYFPLPIPKLLSPQHSTSYDVSCPKCIPRSFRLKFPKGQNIDLWKLSPFILSQPQLSGLVWITGQSFE